MKTTPNIEISEDEFYQRAFSRNIGLVTELEQKRLRKLTVGIPGMGGVGGIHLATLARSGIGNFKIADFDTYEVENFNRQYGAFVDSVGKSKLELMCDEAKRINPFLNISKFEEGITDGNIEEFLDGLDIIVDGLDFFAIDIRIKLFDRAQERGIHIVTAAPIGYGSSILIFSPFKGMKFSDYFNFKKTDSPLTQQTKFAIGLSPNTSYLKTFVKNEKLSLKTRKTPSLGLACQMCASLAACEVLKIAFNRGKVRPAPFFRRFDCYLGKEISGIARWGNRGPLQRIKSFFFERHFKNLKSQESSHVGSKSNDNEEVTDNEALSDHFTNYLLEKAVLAPSGDNSQHWLFKVDSDSISIYRDEKRSYFDYSIGGLAQFLSYGSVAENIVIAASNFGHSVTVEFDATDQDSELIAKTTFSKGEVKKDPLCDFIEHRQTNRNKYLKTPIQTKVISELQDSICGFTDVNLHIIKESGKRDVLTTLVKSGDYFVWETEMLHRDLFRWVRFNNESLDGLTIGTLGLDLHEYALFPFLKNWKTMQILNKIGFSKLAAVQKSKNLMQSSALHAVLTVKAANINNYFEAGRAAQRFWLTANSLGLSLQPMTSSVMMLHHSLFGSKNGFNPNNLKLIDDFQDQWKKLFDLESEVPVMIFRVGYANPTKHRTSRRPFKEMLKQ